MSNKKTLTKSQKEAIYHYEGPLMIVAGPGAGKTWVLIQRVLHLIQEKNVDPSSILLTTFTNKAADELKSRLSREIGEKAEYIHISTIHSFCKYILRKYPEYHNLGSGFDVLDEDSQLLFLRNNLEEFNFNESRLGDLMGFYNKCGENEIDPNDLIKKIKEKYPNNKTNLKSCQAYKRYLELLNEYQLIDFCGLQVAVRDILENNPHILDQLRDKYLFLLIDEYQDTSPIQDRIFQLIAYPQNNICVVGDEDQSIYSFRGANMRNFIKFPEKYPETTKVVLNKNFRSTTNIIRASEKFMSKHRMIKKEIEPWRSKGNEMVLLNNSARGEEAHQIVKLIHDMKEHDIIPHYGYITLLFRSVKNQAGALVSELKKANIKYTIRGDQSFLKRDEIQATLYMLHYVDDKDYGKKFKTRWGRWWDTNLLMNELMDISPETVMKLKEIELSVDITSITKKEDFEKYSITNKNDIQILSEINKFKKALQTKEMDVLNVFYTILDISKYLKRLTRNESEKNEDILFNLSKLSGIIKRYQDFSKDPTLEDFLRFLFSLPKTMQYDEEMLEDPRSVKIMTVHQAKGLEFPVVFICGVSQDQFPLKHRNRDPFPIPDELLKFVPDGQINEERRLFYVAMTRAQDNLIISPGGKKSQFIEDDLGIEEFSDVDTIIEKCEERDVAKNPLHVSFSSIKTYNSCPFRYKLIYHYLFEYQPTFDQKYGIIIHNSLNMMHESLREGEEININKIEYIVNKNWIKLHNNEEDDEDNKNNLITQIWHYYDHMKDHIQEVISTEESFSLFTENTLISGRTDLVIKNSNNQLELFDFKARGESALEKLQVEMQLKIYDYCLKEKYGFDKLCAYHFFTNEKTYFTKNNDYNEIRSQIDAVCSGINNEIFHPAPSSHCRDCFFSFCCEDLKEY
ncbi:ATP-dependent DNA helicase [Methanobacterium alcaliphilum]|uniref:ATP-dependent DNA helicase n=1 Tax=Methanobacterium alcaliphilum TaxID=392018 RepID=UPI00200A07A9|nr:ATP-dependent DNA helicase [Methanobacterium alcaliphilum]MCK9151669.1 ATP-dependent helicase [Methanobacterium alcaliphilum]